MKSGYRKGQLTMVNLIALFITAIMFMCLLPLLNTVIDTTVTSLALTPTPFTALITTLLYFLPALFLFSIIMTGFNYAIPQREGQTR